MPKISGAPHRCDFCPRRVCLVEAEGWKAAGGSRRTNLDRKLNRRNRSDGEKKERYEQPTRARGVDGGREGQFRFLFAGNLPVRFGRRLAVAWQRMGRFERLFASDDWIWNFFWHVRFLENEIDKRVVFLRGQDDQREPAEREANRRLRKRHALGPIPCLFPGPNHQRGDA